MDALFILFVLWVLVMLFFESLFLPLLEVLVMVIWFICYVLVTALITIARCGGTILLVLVSAIGKALWRSICAALRSRMPEPWQEPEPEPARPRYTPYEAACILFELEPGQFDRAAFKRAYRDTMRRVHPDLGGSVESAQIANWAHDVICRAHGWR